MNQYLKAIQDLLQQNNQLSEQEKESVIKAITDADKQWSITDFKLDRTEKVKKTTAILLEETISELEQKRKAVEAQNRELEIESSLERVRARAMAMQKSDELKELISTVSAELGKLDIVLDRCFIITYDTQTMGSTWWMSHPETPSESFGLFVKYHEHPPYLAHIEAWKERKLKWQYILEGEIKETWDQFLFAETELSQLPGFVIDVMRSKKKIYLSSSFNNFGYLTLATNEPLSEEQFDIMLRFAKVFDLTYTRFNDLKQAEAQARESQIQLALERVRARTMAMQRSDELSEAASLLFQQVQSLGAPQWTAGYCIFDEDKRAITLWMSGPWGDIQPPFRAPLDENPSFINYLEAHNKGLEMYIEENSAKVNEENYQYLLTLPVVGERLNSIIAKGLSLPTYQVDHCAYFSKGFLLFITYQQVPQLHSVFKRFAAVFDQTYTRFLDLQKAEAQARESQIEAALERVRARAMAMHTSQELKEVAHELRKQLGLLGLKDLDTCVIHLHDEFPDFIQAWAAIRPPESMEEIRDFTTMVPKKGLPIIEEAMEAYTSGRQDYVLVNEGKKMNQWLNFMKKELPEAVAIIFESMDRNNRDTMRSYWSLADFAGGSLVMVTLESPDETSRALLRRFANVFGLAYRRFADLKQAEAQAREAKIEAALERVRSRTMAMQHSDELADASFILDSQVRALGIKTRGCAFNIYGENESTEWFSSAAGTMPRYKTPRENVFLRYYEEGKNGKLMYIESFEGDACAAHYDYLCTIPVMGESLKKFKESGGSFPAQQVDHVTYFKYGYLLFITLEPVPDAHDIFKRFAAVFEQTYTRFLDLKKAEAQAREAQIEAALEKVRSRTMAMQRSAELADVATVLFQQVKALGVPQWACGFCIFEIDDQEFTWYSGGPDGEILPPAKVPLTEHPVFIQMNESRKRGDELYIYEKTGEAQADHYRYMITIPVMRERLQNMLDAGLSIPSFQIDHLANFSHGNLTFITYEHFPEMHDIFKRFAKVFEQTYTRFLDLQIAEAQAREAKIEAALERVRARTMAMQKSDELDETNKLIFRQLESLDISLSGSGIHICYADKPVSEAWMGDPLTGKMPKVIYNHTHDRLSKRMYEGWKKGETLFVEEVKGEKLKEHLEYVLPLLPDPTVYEDSIQEFVFHTVYFTYGFLVLATPGHCPTEHPVFIRFAKVFEQTYTRFLDLQKAEAQAREAKIEAALEKVRSRSMAMQRSAELAEVATVLFQQVKALGVHQWACGFGIFEIDDKEFTWYQGSEDGNMLPPCKIPLTEHPVFIQFNESRKRGDELYIYEKTGELQTDHYRYMCSLPVLGKIMQDALDAGMQFPTFQIDHVASFSHGNLVFITYEHFPEMHDVFKRFAKVFDQTYTRFLDLQKAEAQAREAQIETALEKVRSRSMGMQKSDELRQVVAVLYEQMEPLGLAKYGCELILCNEQTDQMEFWHANPIQSVMPECYYVSRSVDPICEQQWKAWKEGTSGLIIELKGEKKQAFDNVLLTKTDFKKLPDDIKKWINAEDIIVLSFATMKFGFLEAVDTEALHETKLLVLNRFAKVFEQTYTRFNDLKQAEAQALEAIRRASIDRIRAEIASMRTTNDLERIQPLIWTELKILGIPFIRCGVFIMDEGKQEVQTMLSTPDGKAIATLHVPFEFNLSIITNGVDNWRRKKIYKEHWDAAAFTQTWIKLSSLRETSMDAPPVEHPPESLYLHLLPFLQGMLYVGNDTPLTDDELNLVQILADAFSTAYARYEDFNKLEAAKKQVDSTLDELQTTQKQLIQSEKMASLGELTAGIAHEIQNPLNFVNNFSEVNKELLAEMKDEIAKGNIEEVKAIANDIISNEEKISHHGKRADAIVKGMLQHSRSTSTVKEPANINALADEYLRLSYHGLRAKDKSFNATMKTDFDGSISNINIIPQDIGRVLLNLYNNSFYAVSEKKKQQTKNYEPTVSIKTIKLDGKIEISVKDNGDGIPQKALDKIFQPFFTTKPTGQGTGLGLSLAYDIVKAHGGELKVETKEGEGSTFIISIPTNN